MLYMCVGCVIAFWPKGVKCLVLMSSGPVGLLLLAFCIACFVSCSEILICVFCTFSIFLSMTVVHCRVFCYVSELFVKALAFL